MDNEDSVTAYNLIDDADTDMIAKMLDLPQTPKCVRKKDQSKANLVTVIN